MLIDEDRVPIRVEEDLDNCRYDVAVEVPADFRERGAVGVADFPALRVAEIEIAGSIELELRALDWRFRTWPPQSGRVPDDQPC